MWHPRGQGSRRSSRPGSWIPASGRLLRLPHRPAGCSCPAPSNGSSRRSRRADIWTCEPRSGVRSMTRPPVPSASSNPTKASLAPGFPTTKPCAGSASMRTGCSGGAGMQEVPRSGGRSGPKSDEGLRAQLLALSLALALLSRLAAFGFPAGRLLAGSRGGLARRRRDLLRRFGHFARGAVKCLFGLAGRRLHHPRHTVRRLSSPSGELLQPVPDSLLLLRVDRGIKQPLCLGFDVLSGTTKVAASLSEELLELLFPALV